MGFEAMNDEKDHGLGEIGYKSIDLREMNINLLSKELIYIVGKNEMKMCSPCQEKKTSFFACGLSLEPH